MHLAPPPLTTRLLTAAFKGFPLCSSLSSRSLLPSFRISSVCPSRSFSSSFFSSISAPCPCHASFFCPSGLALFSSPPSPSSSSLSSSLLSRRFHRFQSAQIEARQLRPGDYFQTMPVKPTDPIYKVQSIDIVARGRGGTYYKIVMTDCFTERSNLKLTVTPSEKCETFTKYDVDQIVAERKNAAAAKKAAGNSAAAPSGPRPSVAEHVDETLSATFLYASPTEGTLHLMDPTTFEQIEINLNSPEGSQIALEGGNIDKFMELKENTPIEMQKHEGKLVGLIIAKEG